MIVHGFRRHVGPDGSIWVVGHTYTRVRFALGPFNNQKEALRFGVGYYRLQRDTLRRKSSTTALAAGLHQRN